MAKKITLNDIANILTAHAKILAGQGKEISDLSHSIAHVVKHMATKDDLAELKGDIVRVQEQVTSIEHQLKHGRYETRLTKLENEVFGSPRR